MELSVKQEVLLNLVQLLYKVERSLEDNKPLDPQLLDSVSRHASGITTLLVDHGIEVTEE